MNPEINMHHLNYLVLQSLDQAARKDLTPIKLRAKAAKFAKQTVKTQMESFKVNFWHYFVCFLITVMSECPSR